MGLTNDVIAAWVLGLVGPAVLFVTALFIRRLPPPESEPARTAERIVRWYAAHPQFALWVLLLLLPLSAFILGSAALLRTWDDNPQLQVLRVENSGGDSGSLAGRVHRRGDPPVGGRADDDDSASHGRAGSWPSVRVALTALAAERPRLRATPHRPLPAPVIRRNSVRQFADDQVLTRVVLLDQQESPSFATSKSAP